MLVAFRLVYLCAALLSGAAGVLIVASCLIPGRAPHSTEYLGIHLAVGATFLGIGVLLFGIQRHLSGVAALARHGHAAEAVPGLTAHLGRLLAYLLAGGVLLGAVLGVMTYAILARIDQGFAVFG